MTAAAGDDPYTQAVARAYDIVRTAHHGDSAAAAEAATVLRSGTGSSQPEILDDLDTKPPDLEDARTRLSSLLKALQSPVDSRDPAHDQAAVNDVLRMHRYDSLHTPPSLFDRFLAWLRQAIDRLLGSIPFGAGIDAGRLLIALAILGVAIAILLIVVTRWTRRRRPAPGLAEPVRRAQDLFGEADRLAAGNDYTGALRALCAAVAAALGGERTWDSSPLTVREIFNRAANPAALRPLLYPFEAAFYGGRPVTQAAYDRAVAAADPYRTRQVAA